MQALLRAPEPNLLTGEGDTMLEVMTGFDIDGNACAEEMVDQMEGID